MAVKSYKDKNGKIKYYCSFYYTDYNGIKKRKKIEGFLRSKDAKQAEADFLDKITGSSEMSFKALADLYLKDCKSRLKPTTYFIKNNMFEKNLIPYFSDVRVIDITPVKIREWQNKLLERVPAYKPTYIKSLNNQMSAFFNFCVRFYGLKANPIHSAGSVGKNRSGRLDFYTLDEFDSFMEALHKITNDKAISMFFELLFYTGCRCGELLALTTDDFDADKNTIDINKNFAVADGKQYILPPKTPKSKRIITLPSKVSKHFQDYLQTLYDPQPKERIFATINKDRLAKMVRKASALAGIKRIRVHDFRHSHASLLIELGFSPLLISERLGHEKVETTLQIYSHLYPTKAEEVAKKLDDFVK